jgi:hypothetical protein
MHLLHDSQKKNFVRQYYKDEYVDNDQLLT